MTSEADARCLETFPNWLRSLGHDAEAMVDALNASGVSEAAQRALAAGLNYVFKSVDLIPDGIDDIGYLDDAFVLRIAVAQAARTMRAAGRSVGAIRSLRFFDRAVREGWGSKANRRAAMLDS